MTVQIGILKTEDGLSPLEPDLTTQPWALWCLLPGFNFSSGRIISHRR